jgi:penicillin-binding protein 1C
VVLAAFIVFLASVPLPRPLFPDDYSLVILGTDGSILRVFLDSREQWHLPPSPEEVPEKLVRAVTAFEDRRFFLHPGIDPFAVLRAVNRNLSSPGRRSGASTLTMQVARIMKPKARTGPNKVMEALRALKIEILYSKKDILRTYLDQAPFGGNTVGFRTAAWRYYGKEPVNLTWSEAATLAVLPNSPALVSPQAAPERLRAKRNRLLGVLKDSGVLTDREYSAALNEPVPETAMPFPNEAPHLAEFLKRQVKSTSVPVHTTLDPGIQRSVRDLAIRHADYLGEEGIRNLAVLVAETETGKVRAYIGSQNFFDSAAEGQVDGVRARRSTGSLLKPVLYALAMDEGLLLPETRIKDIPSWFGAFSPANANEKYSGLVAVRDALILSLNVPAVLTLNRYGLEDFYGFLKDAGLGGLFRSPGDYGLPLILGGAEASPWEIARLYRGLGRHGLFSGLLLREDQKPEPDKRLLSAGAAHLTLNILKEVRRPGPDFFWRSFAGMKPLAWKTGTSYGQRDAWAAGVGPDWTIVVWAGNFSGRENPNLKSTLSAGPLLFDIFNTLSARSEGKWFSPPPGALDSVSICPDTGYRAGPDCPNPVSASAPAAAKPLPECPYHTPFFVTPDERYRVTSKCRVPGNYKRIVRLIYPPDIAQFLRSGGRPADDIPPLFEGCEEEANSLVIVYPKNNAKFFLPRELDGVPQKLLLRAAHGERGKRVFWYAGGTYLGETLENHTMAASFSRGAHTLTLVDEAGNRAQILFYVDIASTME